MPPVDMPCRCASLDSLEQTQDVEYVPFGDGVFRVVHDEEGGPGYFGLQRAPELSARYEFPRIDFTRRQAE